jgi:hypothetical protein
MINATAIADEMSTDDAMSEAAFAPANLPLPLSLDVLVQQTKN